MSQDHQPFYPAVAVDRFFDWASTSPLSIAAARAMHAYAKRTETSLMPARTLAEETLAVERIRTVLRAAFGANSTDAVVFVRSVSEALTYLAAGYGQVDGGNVVVTAADHAASVLPWMYLGAGREVELRTARVLDDGRVDLNHFSDLLDQKTMVVSCTHVSHLDGIRQPVEELVALTRERSAAIVVIDGAQAVGRIEIDLAAIGADMYIASGRKALLGPLGAGFVIAGPEVLAPGRGLISPRNRTARLTHSGWASSELTDDVTRQWEGNLPDLRCLNGLVATVEAARTADGSAHRRLTSALVDRLAQCCADHGVKIVSPVSSQQTGIVRINVGMQVDHRLVHETLCAWGYSLAPDRNWLRISLLGFNHPFMVEELVVDILRASRV